MTKKTVSIASKSNLKENTPKPDNWVSNRTPSNNEKMKRLTIDVTQTLHAKIKVACAQRGTKMADEIRAILEREFSS